MMNGDVLANQIISALGDVPDEAQQQIKIFCNVLVAYIQTNATVPPGITVQVACPAGSGATAAPGKVL